MNLPGGRLGVFAGVCLVSITPLFLATILSRYTTSAIAYTLGALLVIVLSAFYSYMASRKHHEAAPGNTGSHPRLNSLAVPAIAIDENNQVIFANPAAKAYFSNDDIDTTGLFDVLKLSYVVGEETLTDWLRACRFEDKQGLSQSWERVRHELPSGSYREFDMVAHYTPDPDIEYQAVLIFIDHTARYLGQDNDVGYVALAVHELRTPLTVMRGYIEIFEDEVKGSLDSEQKEFLGNLSAQAQTLTDFVSSILNVARIEENHLQVKLREEDWPAIVNKAVDDMQLRAKVRDVRLVVDIDENIGQAIVDRVSIYEILNNLIDNAIKYTHTDQDVLIKTYLKDSNTIETTISDHGVGIPEDVIPHLFKKFYRSHSSRNVAVGTGIGLYLCRALVTAHGGQIWVKSEQGKGSTFGFTIPLDQPIAKDELVEDNGIKRTAHGWIKENTDN
ncbi:MAG: ATP-binding protein [Patescibacteria group bacterium]